jgi:hypothetical protein
MPTQDQVTWAAVNLVVGGETQSFTRGALLPEVTDGEESAHRSLLRAGGAIRTVEVVYTPEELAAAAKQRGEAAAANAAQHDVDPALPSGGQVTGTAKPGPPTLEAPGHAPVVVGPEPDAKPAPRAAKPAAGKE